jgi:hypothetical protein
MTQSPEGGMCCVRMCHVEIGSGFVTRIFSCRSELLAFVGPLLTCYVLQGVPGGNVSILGGHNTGHSKQKNVYVHVSYSERFPRYN